MKTTIKIGLVFFACVALAGADTIHASTPPSGAIAASLAQFKQGSAEIDAAIAKAKTLLLHGDVSGALSQITTAKGILDGLYAIYNASPDIFKPFGLTDLLGQHKDGIIAAANLVSIGAAI